MGYMSYESGLGCANSVVVRYFHMLVELSACLVCSAAVPGWVLCVEVTSRNEKVSVIGQYLNVGD